MRAAIQRHGGTVEKFIGDAVVGTFGLPSAHEDDTLRAVRAAFDMRDSAASLDADIGNSEVRVLVRIAIDCGETFADESAAMQGRVGGDTFNTAARLQSTAAPGEVLVSAAAAQMIRGRVELVTLDPVSLKGKVEPVRAFRVASLDVQPARPETPLVGRARHLSMLRHTLEDAIESQACVLVTVLAPPGVGKSRLTAEFQETLEGVATVLVGQTPSYGDGVAFAPLLELLTQAAGERRGDAEQISASLRSLLDGQPDGFAIGDRLAQLLGVGEGIASDASWAVRRLLEVLAAERPLVVVLEDVHWAEPPLLDLFDAVIERVHGPVLVLCLARPELLEQRPTWGAGRPRAITMTLPPLSQADARRVAEGLLGPGVPARVVDRVCEVAEGNPLYLEQLTGMLSDQGLLVDGRWVGSEEADVEIPPTLQALLASRLDRLEPTTRLVLERASVEGRRFRLGALEALAPDLSAESLESAMVTLERRGLFQPEDEAGGRWRFAHALVREAAYRGLSKKLRAALHVQLADWMGEVDVDQADVDESVARHLERALQLLEELGERNERSAELSARAGELFANAGLRAFAALDYNTAGDLLGRAAALLPQRSLRRLEIAPIQGAALVESGRTEDAEVLLSEAVEQARAVGSERDVLRATVQLLSNRLYRSFTEELIETSVVEARSAAAAFETMGDHVGLAEVALIVTYFEGARGDYVEAQRWAFKTLRHALLAGRTREAIQGAADVLVYAAEGPQPFDQFPQTARDLFALAEPISISTGHAFMAIAALAADDEPGFAEHEAQWRMMLDRNGMTWLAATQGLTFANAEILVGRAATAEVRLRQARELLAPYGNIWWVDLVDAALCHAVEAQGRTREFLRLADAFADSARMTEQLLPDRRRVHARAQLLRGSAPEAEAAARRALKLSKSTDCVYDQVNSLFTLADILDVRGLTNDAVAARNEATEMLRVKGNMAAITYIGQR